MLTFRGEVMAIEPQRDPSPNAEAEKVAKKLTPREIEVMQLLALGFSYAQIADLLDVTVNTLKTHIRRAYRKLQVHNRIQAVQAARRQGYTK